MINKSSTRIIRTLSLVLCALMLAACGDFAKNAEDRDPNLKRARARRAAGDYSGAIEAYEKALEKKPNSARIHWEIASVYDQYVTNDLRAIYHYERYLELDPKAERRRLAEELIGAAKLSFAASLPARPSEAVQEIARLRKEADTLRAMLTETQEELAEAKGSKQTAPNAASASAPAAALSDRVLQPAPAKVVSLESYTVQPGDTLSRIAGKVYGDTGKWNVIFDANRNNLKKPESVKVGQILVIPR